MRCRVADIICNTTGTCGERNNSEAQYAADLDLSHLPEEWKTRLRIMLDKYKHMWDGSLGAITAKKHYINLIPGTCPILQCSYHSGSMECDVVSKQVDQLLEQKVIRHSNFCWASPVL